ncbi:putative glutathione transferase [Helianthus annuus]|nr:putative glutathione transferase [Helianthus annuus]
MTSSSEKKLQLYSYHRSSCSFRVRIALNLKEFLKVNPIGYVPALVDGDLVIADSFAIIMYLEEKYPQHPLLPRDLAKKAINYQVNSFRLLCIFILRLCNIDDNHSY